MNVHSDDDVFREEQRKKIIGLGDLSIRKSYYPELQQQQEAVKESETLLRSILHASPVMQFVVDKNHRVISWNRALETYSGIHAEDILGTDSHWRAFYPEKRPLLSDILVDESVDNLPVWYKEKFRESRLVAGGIEVTDFFPGMSKTGKWLHATAVAIRDKKGTVTGAIETIEDITEQKNAEDALKQNEQFLRNVVENIPDMIFVKDARTLTYVRVNKAGEDLLGYARQDLYGKSDYDFYSKEEADFFTRQDREVLETGKIVDIPEEKIRTGLKGERILHTKEITIFDENCRPRYLLGISEDITERRRMESALQLARNKMNLLNTITFQDIKNTAFTLRAYTDLMKTFVNDEKTKEYLEKQAGFHKKILDSLDFARNYQDMGAKPPQWQDISLIFLYAISHLDFLHITRDVRVEGLEIYADPLLEKVFFNLMQNVLLYGERADRVTIWYREKPDGLVLTVEDNGVGIPGEEKHLIFNRGYGKGGGLGLFLVREILSITGITIAETGIPGEGAKFEISVPKECYRFAKEKLPG